MCNKPKLSNFVVCIINNIFYPYNIILRCTTGTLRNLEILIFCRNFQLKIRFGGFWYVPFVRTSTTFFVWVRIISKYSQKKYRILTTYFTNLKATVLTENRFLEEPKCYFLKNWLLHINNATKLSQNLWPNFKSICVHPKFFWYTTYLHRKIYRHANLVKR